MDREQLIAASAWAERATRCMRRGCVAIIAGHQFINGDADCRGLRGKCGCTHAEQRAITWALRFCRKPQRLYVTMAPCTSCARLIIASQIVSEVYYLRAYWDLKEVQCLMMDAQIPLLEIGT